MKRTVCLLLTLLLVFSLSACGDGGNNDTPTEPQGGEVFSETVQRCSGMWYQDPMHGGDTIEVQPNGICVIQGQSYSYSVVSETEEEIVLNADEYHLQIYLNPSGVPELYLSTDWNNTYLQKVEYWEFLGKEWYSDDGDTMVILAAEIHTPAGSFTEFAFDDRGAAIEVFQDEQIVCSITLIDSGRVSVTDPDGNEKMYYARDLYYDPEDWEDEPMDEQTRLGLAYDKSLNDFNAAISGQPVYDDEGREIVDGPILAQYLHDQFLALGDFEDAAYYLPFFKTREETVATVQECNYDAFGDVRVTVYDGDLPNYDVFGEPRTTKSLFYLGIFYSQSGKQKSTKVYDENNMLTQVIITSTNTNGDVIGTCVADLEYNDLGQHIATDVAFVDENGNDIRYTSTFTYDNLGQLIRLDIPYFKYRGYDVTHTSQWLYDEYGRCVQDSSIYAFVDEADYDYYQKPASKSVFQYIYDENGLLISEIFEHTNPFDGGGGQVRDYTYDENQRLIKEESYSKIIDWDPYSVEEYARLLDQIQESCFHPGVSASEATQEDWFSMEPVDLNMWDWLGYTVVRDRDWTYTYDRTVTIMYIDLTPED